ncbi:hypothetical protein SPONN_135 [uncultured Candidatus Thioglobus sp.]|nr:hypothetical protein SPONN_135 [uncultured Candidatus Thioglobus sp.]
MTSTNESSTSHNSESVAESFSNDVPLKHFHESLEVPLTWCDRSPEALTSIQLCKISSAPSSTQQPLVLTHCLTINDDFTWSLYVHNHHVDHRTCSALSGISDTLDLISLTQLLALIDNLNICIGHTDSHLVSMVSAKKGRILSGNGKVVASVDSYASVFSNGTYYTKTIRTSDCQMVSSSSRCEVCTKYRPTLRAMYHRWSKGHSKDSATSSHTNERYLSTPEKKKMKTRLRTAEHQVLKLKEKITKITSEFGDKIDSGLQSDLLAIMNEKTDAIHSVYSEGSFSRLFWDQQLRAASASNLCQMRWHPLIIKWCLNLKLISSGAYHALRSTGFVKLPSERTLRDYTHYFKHHLGFQKEVLVQLTEEVKDLEDPRRYVSVVFDEMKVKQDLVYDKHSGHIVGFISLGSINDELAKLENGCVNDVEQPPIAKQLLVFMVRGLFSHLTFPYMHFGSRGVTGAILYPIVWEVIEQLESIGLKVMCITSDGASPNRKFFKLNNRGKFAHKTTNPFASDNREIFFISDPPHLVKTVRNCWSHSAADGTRHMLVCTISAGFDVTLC